MQYPITELDVKDDKLIEGRITPWPEPGRIPQITRREGIEGTRCANTNILLTGVEHEVKSWTNLYDPLVAGWKTADIRDKRDRNYRVGDMLIMRRYDFANGVYTGEKARCLITHIISNDTPCAMSSTGLDRNLCILSLRLFAHKDADGNDLTVPK